MYPRAQVHGRSRCSVLTPVCLLVLFTAGQAEATPLPAASTNVFCSADGNSEFGPTECTQGGFPGVPSSAFASVTLSPSPFVSVEATAPPTAVLGAGASATALYYFQVTGGEPGDAIPILIDFALGASSTPESSALARLIYYTTVMGSVAGTEEVVCNPQVCDETEFSDTLSLVALSGATLNSLTLYVEAQAPPTHFSTESARAFADPYIYIDPAFPNASLYSVVVSPGVGNVPLAQVPEPATLGLVGSVLVAFGLLRRKHL
jgi:hypothetical protein